MLKKLFRNYSFGIPDYKFIAIVGALVLFGLVALASASVPSSFERYGYFYYFTLHQLFFGILPGLILCLGFALFDYRILKRYAFVMLVVSIVLLGLVFIPGIGAQYGSAHSWLNIFGFSVQPSEIVKLTFLVYLASWLESRGERRVGDFNEGVIPFLLVLGVIMFLLMMEPDTGSMGIIVVMSMAVYLIGGANLKHVFSVFGLGIAGLFLMAKLSPYRAARLTTFLHPELDPQGIGYHVNQALLAVGSGGFFGVGFGLSRQKFQYLPEVMGDSIFAIISEEMGFVVATMIVLGFFYFFSRGYKIALESKDAFGKYLVFGIITWITFQSILNIGAMLSILPLTGVPLPFISYGGTAMVVNLAAVGIIINVSRQASAHKKA